jgi:hypothetical protein
MQDAAGKGKILQYFLIVGKSSVVHHSHHAQGSIFILLPISILMERYPSFSKASADGL